MAKLAVDIVKLPVARLEFRRALNPEDVERMYKFFTKPHPRYRLFQNKSLGAALVPLTKYKGRDDYMQSIKGHNSAEQHARKAKKKGYVVVAIDRNDYVDDIHEINTSVDIRQGRPMDQAYLEKQTRYPIDKNYAYYGVLNQDGKLKAYCDFGIYGNFAAFNRLMGVRNNDGVMHLMVTEVICQMIEAGAVNYVMYDTCFGASAGLATFKKMLGFEPFRAKYSIQ
jgi:transposase